MSNAKTRFERLGFKTLWRAEELRAVTKAAIDELLEEGALDEVIASALTQAIDAIAEDNMTAGKLIGVLTLEKWEPGTAEMFAEKARNSTEENRIDVWELLGSSQTCGDSWEN